MNISHHAELVLDYDVEKVEVVLIPKGGEVVDRFINKFGIDDARELIHLAHNRPSHGDEIFFVVRTSFVTHEAQNALLKVLEDPPLSTKFVFVLPPDFILLPTLKSRFNFRNLIDKGSDFSDDVFKIFLKKDYKDRLAEIERAIKGKDIVWQRSIKNGLIRYLASSGKDNDKLAKLEYICRMLLTRGASNKMLLEHLALTLGPRL
jgi:hypothetical protein